jgi:hypothetical protein
MIWRVGVSLIQIEQLKAWTKAWGRLNGGLPSPLWDIQNGMGLEDRTDGQRDCGYLQ